MSPRYLFLLISIALFFIRQQHAYGNDSTSFAGYGIEVNPIAGRIIKHNLIFPPLPDLSTGIDINILKQTDGRKAWQQRRKYPLIGLGITYTDYGLNDVYGKCIGVYPVWQFNIIKGKKLEWTCRFGMGVGYVTRYYQRHPTWDTVNNLIGSAINNFTMLSSDVRYHINKHWDVQIGLTGTHISNGDFRRPNLGVNLVGGHIGLRYFPVTSKPILKKNNLPKLSGRWLLQARMGIGLIEYGMPDGPQYPVYMPSLFVSKRYGSRNKVYAGVDYAFYQSVYMFLKNNEIDYGKQRAESTEMSVFIGNEFLIGRFGMVLQVGYPFVLSALHKGVYVAKMGYNFYIVQAEKGLLKELTMHTYIKANKLQASAVEFGLGAAF